MPTPGTLVAIDAEFVLMQQVLLLSLTRSILEFTL